MTRPLIFAIACLWELTVSLNPSVSLAAVMKDHAIGIGVAVPPARILITDSLGRRAGVDPSVTLTAEGMPPVEVLPGTPPRHRQLGILQEIPNTDVMPENTSTVGVKPRTGWYAEINDGGSQTYLVTLTGMTRGTSRVRIRPHRAGGRDAQLPVYYVSALMDAGLVRQFRVTFDPPRSYVPEIERLVTASGLSEDVETACELNLIGPRGVCKSLQAKAIAVAASVQRGDKESARGQINALLNELKAQGGKHVKEPATTIIREEAKALLRDLDSPQASKSRTPG